MAIDREKILSRLESLMKRTRENGASEAEVEAAMRVARKLMDENNIEMEELLEKQKRTLNTTDVVDHEVRSHCKKERHEDALMWAVCYATDTRWYYTQKWVLDEKKGKHVKQFVRHIVGLEQDVTAARVLFLELLLTMRTMARVKLGTKWTQQHFWYCNGFAEALCTKCRDMQDASKKEAETRTASNPGTGIILVKNEIIQAKLEELGIVKKKPSRVGGRGEFSSDAYNTGRRDGYAQNVSPDRHSKVDSRSKNLN